MPTGLPWADDQFTVLLAMAAEGHTGGQIANAITAQFGVRRTRNAVIGKLHRMGLGLAGPQPEHLTRQAHHSPRRRASALVRPAPQQQPDCVSKSRPRKGVTFRALKPRRCRYPYGDRWPFRFCGARAVEGKSWCEAHYELVFRPLKYRP